MVKPSRKVSNSLQLVTRTRGTCIHYNTPSIITSFIVASLCVHVIRHSDDAIEKLESAGLGFFIKEEETKQKLGKPLQYILESTIMDDHIRGLILFLCAGSTPLRHLVYRVLDLPDSMKPLVYDYGSLCTATERAYIRRMVKNHVS